MESELSGAAPAETHRHGAARKEFVPDRGQPGFYPDYPDVEVVDELVDEPFSITLFEGINEQVEACIGKSQVF